MLLTTRMSSQLDPTLIMNALITKQLSTSKKEGANKK
jgi:hypothetical protein